MGSVQKRNEKKEKKEKKEKSKKKRKEKKRKEKKRKEEKREEKNTPFGVNLLRSQVLGGQCTQYHYSRDWSHQRSHSCNQGNRAVPTDMFLVGNGHMMSVL